MVEDVGHRVGTCAVAERRDSTPFPALLRSVRFGGQVPMLATESSPVDSFLVRTRDTSKSAYRSLSNLSDSTSTETIVFLDTTRSIGESWSTRWPSMVTDARLSRSELDRCLLSSSTIVGRMDIRATASSTGASCLNQTWTCAATVDVVAVLVLFSLIRTRNGSLAGLGRCVPRPVAGMILASICSSFRVPDTWTGGVPAPKLRWNSRARLLIVRRIPSTSVLYRRSPRDQLCGVVPN